MAVSFGIIILNLDYKLLYQILQDGAYQQFQPYFMRLGHQYFVYLSQVSPLHLPALFHHSAEVLLVHRELQALQGQFSQNLTIKLNFDLVCCFVQNLSSKTTEIRALSTFPIPSYSSISLGFSAVFRQQRLLTAMAVAAAVGHPEGRGCGAGKGNVLQAF